jgi:hypothetical protein
MTERWKRLSRRWKALAAAAAIALLAIVPLQLATADETGSPADPDAGFTIERGNIVLPMSTGSPTSGTGMPSRSSSPPVDAGMP